MKKIYNYHPDTNELISESEVRLDPIEEKPLIPAYATTAKPPVTEKNEVAVFVDDTWQVLPDYRGSEYYLADGTFRTIENIGEVLPADALNEAPLPSFDELKQEAVKKMLAFATDARARITGYADQYKLAGWNDKSQRAQRIIANTASDADIAILQAECDKRGKDESPQELAQKQAAKGQALATAIAIIDGMESAALKAIESKRSENTLSALLDQLQTEANAELNRLLGE